MTAGVPIGIADAILPLGALLAVIVRVDPDDPDEFSGDVIPLVRGPYDCLAVVDVLRCVANGIEARCLAEHTGRAT